MIRFLTLLILLLAIPFVTVAEDKPFNSDDLFCDALYDEKTYEGRYRSYKMLIPGDDGWIFRTTRDLQSSFDINDSAKRYIKKIQDSFAEKGITFVMLYVPTRGLMHNDVIRDKDLKKFGFNDIDGVWDSYLGTVKDAKEDGINIFGLDRTPTGMDYFYRRDHHWNQAGAKYTAEKLAAYIKTLPVYDGLNKTDFKTVEVAPFDFEGVSDKVFKQVCDTVQPPEKITQLLTEPVETAAAADDLFGEAPEPEVVLLGTSNSTMEPSFANFEGFLKESLSTDILNMSVSGGGIDTAIISYLNSDHFKQGKAKMVVWEVPGYYDLNKHFGMYRQVAPAIYNDCGGDALASKTTEIKNESAVVLSGLADKDIQGSDYYAYFNFSKPLAENFTVDFRYIKNRDKYKIRRSKRYPHDGEFYLALKASKRANLEKIVLELPKEAIGLTLDTKICKM